MTDIREQEMQGKIDELTAQKASLEAEMICTPDTGEPVLGVFS